jgi:hypothetical protein
MSFARFKKETTIKILNGQMAPVYNNDMGIKFHTVPTEKPKYSTTSRIHGTTKFNWLSRNISKTDRDSLYTFFDTTLDHGYDYMSVIDHKKRILFDASWNNWREKWSRMRGGIHTVQYGIESPYVWTPSIFDAFLMERSANYGRSYLYDITGNAIVLDSGTYNASTVANRLTGYTMRLIAANDSATEKHSSVTGLNYDSTRTYNSITIFCQYFCNAINSTFYLVNLLAAGNGGIQLKLSNDAGNHDLVGSVIDSQGNIDVATVGLTPLTVDTWYDIAITYDSVNSELKLYWAPSGVTSACEDGEVAFTDFLDGATSLTDGVVSATTTYPGHKTYTSVEFLKESAVNTLPSGNKAKMQNIFFVDDYISSMQFNFLRRLCYMWNTKSSGINPV